MIYEHMQHNFLSNRESSTLIVNKHDIYYTKSKQRISWERLEGNIEVVVILKWYKKEADGGRKQTACFYFLPYHKPSQGASLISNNWANVFSPLTLHSIFVHYLNTVFLKKKKKWKNIIQEYQHNLETSDTVLSLPRKNKNCGGSALLRYLSNKLPQEQQWYLTNTPPPQVFYFFVSWMFHLFHDCFITLMRHSFISYNFFTFIFWYLSRFLEFGRQFWWENLGKMITFL